MLQDKQSFDPQVQRLAHRRLSVRVLVGHDQYLFCIATHVISIHHAPVIDSAQNTFDFSYLLMLQIPSKVYLQISKVDVMEALDRINLCIQGLWKDFLTKSVPRPSA